MRWYTDLHGPRQSTVLVSGQCERNSNSKKRILRGRLSQSHHHRRQATGDNGNNEDKSDDNEDKRDDNEDKNNDNKDDDDIDDTQKSMKSG